MGISFINIYIYIYMCIYIYYIHIPEEPVRAWPMRAQGGPQEPSQTHEGPPGPTRTLGGTQESKEGPQGLKRGPQGPRGAHKGFRAAHKTPGGPTFQRHRINTQQYHSK